MPRKLPQPKVTYEPAEELDQAALEAAFDFIFEKILADMQNEAEDDPK